MDNYGAFTSMDHCPSSTHHPVLPTMGRAVGNPNILIDGSKFLHIEEKWGKFIGPIPSHY